MKRHVILVRSGNLNYSMEAVRGCCDLGPYMSP